MITLYYFCSIYVIRIVEEMYNSYIYTGLFAWKLGCNNIKIVVDFSEKNNIAHVRITKKGKHRGIF